MTIIPLTKEMVILKKSLSTIFAYVCFVFLIVCICTDAVGGVSHSSLYGKVLRLHVLADSDSAQDQHLKLMVRDGLLSVTEEMFRNCKDAYEALDVADKNKEIFEKTAIKVLGDNGCKKDVKVVTGIEKYPEKAYGSLTFPAGEYLSVRVLIGSGKGKNWWCVLFPPLCNAGIEEEARVLSSYGINDKEIEKLKKEIDNNAIEIFGCRIKLKILDFFN